MSPQVQGYFYGRPMTETDATEWLMPRAAQPRDRDEFCPHLNPDMARG